MPRALFATTALLLWVLASPALAEKPAARAQPSDTAPASGAGTEGDLMAAEQHVFEGTRPGSVWAEALPPNPFVQTEVMSPLVVVEQPPASPAVQASPVPPPRRGTHALFELNAGAALGEIPAEAGSTLFGLGGKPVGFPWRFYLITEIGQAHIQDVGATGGAPGGGMFEADRRYWSFLGGLRIYIPVWGPVRLLADVTVGGAYVQSSLIGGDLGPLEADDWYVMGAVAGGLQVRLLYHLSVGMRAKLFLADDGLSDLRQVLDVAGGVPATVTAGMTWHI